MRKECQHINEGSLLEFARTLPVDELPQLIGVLAEVNAIAFARLATPAPAAKPDSLLDVEQAAKRLNCSTDYLYTHHAKLPFTRRVGRKLLFSSAGLDSYLRRARP